MGLRSGTTNNINGRPKGARNRIKADDKIFWQKLLKRQRKKILTELNAAKGTDYLNAIIRMNEFVLPKQRQTDSTVQVDGLTDTQVQEMLQSILTRNGK